MIGGEGVVQDGKCVGDSTWGRDCCLNKSQPSDSKIPPGIVFTRLGPCDHELPRSWKVDLRSRGTDIPGLVCNLARGFILPVQLFPGYNRISSSSQRNAEFVVEDDLPHEIVSCRGVLGPLLSHWRLRRVVGGKEVLWMPFWLV